MYDRKKHTLAIVAEQYRAEITSTSPDGNVTVWYEGPYPKPHIARSRITFWQNHYAHHPEREGWLVDGEVQVSLMSWRRF